MSRKKNAKVDSKEIGRLFAEKFKNMPKDASLAESIPNIIWEIMDSVEMPESAKQKMREVQAKFTVQG